MLRNSGMGRDGDLKEQPGEPIAKPGGMGFSHALAIGLFEETGCIACHKGKAVGGNAYRKAGLVEAYKVTNAAEGRSPASSPASRCPFGRRLQTAHRARIRSASERSSGRPKIRISVMHPCRL